MRTKIWLVLLLGVLMQGCATNLEGVRRFAKDSDTVITASNAQFTYLPTSCNNRLVLVALIQGPDSDVVKDTKAACDDIAVAAKAAIGMTKVVSEYAKALEALAQDKFATYSSELDGLAGSVKGLKDSKQVPIVPASSVDALNKLTNLIFEAATKGLRQRELKAMMAQHDALATVLEQVASMMESEYVAALQTEDSEYRQKIVVLKRAFAEREPLRVRELERDLTAARSGVTDKIDAAKKTAAALRGLIAAHAALRDNIEKPQVVDQLRAINDFRKQTNDVREALTKAF